MERDSAKAEGKRRARKERTRMGQRMYQRMHELNLTVGEAALRASPPGMHTPQSRWSEWAARDPMGMELGTVARIATALDCSLDWLVYGRGDAAAAVHPLAARIAETIAEYERELRAAR